MTRDQLKQKITDIIILTVLEYEDEAEKAAEEIMKLWDQGFTYELPKTDCCEKCECKG